MRTGSITLAVLLFSSALFGAADLRVVVTPDRVRAGLKPDIVVTVFNDGPADAYDVVLTITTNGGAPQRFDLFTRHPGGSIGYHLDIPPQPAGVGAIVVSAVVQSPTDDLNLANNSVSKAIEVSTAPDIVVKIADLPTLHPALPFPLTITLENVSVFPAHDVAVTLDIAVAAGALPPECRETAGRVTCNLAEVTSPVSIPMTLIAPPKDEGGNATFTATAHSREADFDESTNQAATTAVIYKTFVVTSTEDAGAGSLRQAIRDANAQCITFDPCAIAFRIEAPSETPWKTIRIASPLPAVSGPREIVIDGETQTKAFGDTNRDGPEIEISGGGATAGDGLTIESRCRSAVANLAVNGFAGSGVFLAEHPWSCFLDHSAPFLWETRAARLSGLFIGTDPTGSEARSNGSRGISTSGGITYATISGCVLSGNARSGLFVTRSSPMTIETNRIGVKAHSDEPLPNGASGIYIGPPYGSGIVDNYLTVANNVVAFNRDFGIAVQPRRSYDPYQPYARLSRNLVWGNGIDAIDVGLDGVATPTIVSQGRLEAPVITSARVDRGSNSTIVEGVLSAIDGRIDSLEVELFASDSPGARGSGDAQQFIDRVLLSGSAATPSARFRFSVPRDLTGLWVTATVSASRFDFEKDDTGQTRIATTELSRPLPVNE